METLMWVLVALAVACIFLWRIRKTKKKMSDDETAALSALGEILDLTSMSDWHLIHAVVRRDVEGGKYGKAFEDAYRKMVDEKGEKRQH